MKLRDRGETLRKNKEKMLRKGVAGEAAKSGRPGRKGAGCVGGNNSLSTLLHSMEEECLESEAGLSPCWKSLGGFNTKLHFSLYKEAQFCL